MSSPAGVWRLAPGLILHYRSWDGEHAVYNNLSGDTHLLAPAALSILEYLHHGAGGQATLSAALARDYQLEPDADLDAEVAALLASLQHLYLIEPA